MIALVFAALVGGMVTFVALLPYGVLIALVAAPFGGSASCAFAGAVLYGIRSYRGRQTAAESADAAVHPR